MSLRLYVYYSGVLGGWAGILAWGLGRMALPGDLLVRAVVQHLLLGGLAACGLCLMESLMMSGRRLGLEAAVRCMAGSVGGLLAGLLGGLLGHALSSAGGMTAFFLVGWLVMGTLLGLSLAVVEMLERAVRGDGLASDAGRLATSAIAGASGAAAGGVLALTLSAVAGPMMAGDSEGILFSGAAGFTLLGASLGLFPAAVRVMLRRAWLQIEAGTEQGREMVLGWPQTTVGRAADCDFRLADDALAPHHARIVRWGTAYLLTNLAAQGGTYLNDKAIPEPTLLRAGDRIRLGKCVLVYHERRKAFFSGAW